MKSFHLNAKSFLFLLVFCSSALAESQPTLISALSYGSGALSREARSAFKPAEVLKTTIDQQGGRRIVVQHLALDPTHPVIPVRPIVATSSAISMATDENRIEADSTFHLLLLSATVYPGPITYLRWSHNFKDGRVEEYSGWSNIDFNHFAGMSTFLATDGEQHSFVMGLGNEEISPKRVPEFKTTAPKFIPDQHLIPAEALITVNSLHKLYAIESDRLAAAYAGRQSAEAAQRAFELANPVQPKDLIIRYRIAETPPKSNHWNFSPPIKMKRLASTLSFVGSCLLCSNLYAVIDTDEDSMSDIWEGLHEFHIGPNPPADQAPSGDIDGDGFSNLVECSAGTDPRDTTDFPRHVFSLIPPVYEVNDSVILLDPPLSTLSWETVPGKSYQAIPSEDLETWSSATGTFLGSGTAQTFESEILYSDGTVPPKMFWRVEINDTDSDLDGLSDYEELHIVNPNDSSKTLDPFNRDSDGDGLTDGAEYIPNSNGLAAFTNHLATDPDGPGLPAGLATDLIGRWDLEESFANFSTANRYTDSSGNNREIVPVLCDSGLEGMPSRGAGTVTRASYYDPVSASFIQGKSGYLGIPRSLLYGRIAYSISMWVKIDSGSITEGRPLASLFSHHRTVPRPAPHAHLIKTDLNGLWIERLADGSQIVKAGNYSYLNYNEQTLVQRPVPLISQTTAASSPVQAGTYDDGKYHHYLLVRNDAIASIYRDGVLLCSSPAVALAAINASGETHTGISIGRFYGEPVETGTQQAYSLATLATFDRIRVWSRPLTANDALALFHQDVDLDNLWDITENNTRKWDDHNGNAIVESGEFTFVANPLRSDPPEK